jgi:hypothetical protein
MIGIAYPSNVTLIYSQIIDLANLKILPTDSVVEKLFGIKKESSPESSGYSSNMIDSMGFVLLLIFVSIFLTLLGWLLYKIVRKIKLFQKVFIMVANKVLFNFFIRAYTASYLVFSIASYKNVLALKFDSFGDSFSSVLAVFMVGVCFITPLAFFIFLSKNFDKLDLESFKNRCFALYGGTDTKRKEAVVYNVNFTLRRLLFSSSVIFCSKFPFA